MALPIALQMAVQQLQAFQATFEAQADNIIHDCESMQLRSLLMCDRLNRVWDTGEAHREIDNRIFTCFPLLPPELRSRIWQFTTSPRLIEVFDDFSRHNVQLPKDEDSGFRWKAQYLQWPNLPIISRVCKESRDLFLREYFLIAYERENAKFPRVERGVYANPMVDTIYLPLFLSPESGANNDLQEFTRSLSKHMNEQAEKHNRGDKKRWRIRNLALRGASLDFFNKFEDASSALFDEFQALETLVFFNTDLVALGQEKAVDSEDSWWDRASWLHRAVAKTKCLQGRARTCYPKRPVEVRVTCAVIAGGGGNVRIFGEGEALGMFVSSHNV